MKKLLFLMSALFLALPTLAQDFTYEYEGQTLTYTVLDEEKKTVEVKGLNISGELVIPATVSNGQSVHFVTSIADSGFNDCTELTSVTISEGVTSIGRGAFYYCTGLTSVTLPASISSIDELAFYYCSGLTNISIPDGVTSIGYGTFCLCAGLTSVTIPETVTSIGKEAFGACMELESITIPSNVTSIGDGAFNECLNLVSVTIPEKVTSIGYMAFSSCMSLNSVTLPASLTSIDEKAFAHCYDIDWIYYAAKDPISADTNIFSEQVYDRAILYVPKEAVGTCRQIDPWRRFVTIGEHDFNGIEEVIADFDGDAPYEIYNLNGVRVGDSIETLYPGLYIVRQGKTVKKIAVK